MAVCLAVIGKEVNCFLTFPDCFLLKWIKHECQWPNFNVLVLMSHCFSSAVRLKPLSHNLTSVTVVLTENLHLICFLYCLGMCMWFELEKFHFPYCCFFIFNRTLQSMCLASTLTMNCSFTIRFIQPWMLLKKSYL